MSLLFKYSYLLFWAGNFSLFFVLSFPSPLSFLSPVLGFFRVQMKNMGDMSLEMGLGSLQGLANLLFSVFFMVLGVNLLGLLPGTFSVSSHFLFSMSLGIPLWFALLLMSFSKFPLVKFGSYIGTGIPMSLGPFIGVCEIISAVMRPLALGLRLAANMLAGHVITSLVANCLVYMALSASVGVLVFGAISFGLFLFEGAVCVIQAYVFMLLLRVYVQEYPA